MRGLIPKQRHLIQKQRIRVRTDLSGHKALALQRRISRLYRKKTLPLISDCFDAFDGDGRIHRIPSLAIDIGALDPGRLEEDFKEKVVQGLWAALEKTPGALQKTGKDADQRKRGISPRKKSRKKTGEKSGKKWVENREKYRRPGDERPVTVSRSEAVFESFRHFVNTGRLPWRSEKAWTDKHGLGALEGEMARFMESSPGPALEFFSGVAADERRFKRLASQFSDDFLEKAVGVFRISPDRALPRLQKDLERMGARVPGLGRLPAGKARLRRWRAVFGAALSKGGPGPSDPAGPERMALLCLAQEARTPWPEFLNSLDAAAEDAGIAPGRGIRKTLEAIRRREHEKKKSEEERKAPESREEKAFREKEPAPGDGPEWDPWVERPREERLRAMTGVLEESLQDFLDGTVRACERGLSHEGTFPRETGTRNEKIPAQQRRERLPKDGPRLHARAFEKKKRLFSRRLRAFGALGERVIEKITANSAGNLAEYIKKGLEKDIERLIRMAGDLAADMRPGGRRRAVEFLAAQTGRLFQNTLRETRAARQRENRRRKKSDLRAKPPLRDRRRPPGEKAPKQRRERSRTPFETGPLEEIYIENAGLALIWPFFEPFFTTLGLLSDRDFTDETARERGVLLLQRLADDSPETPEHLLPLNKVLCGMDLDEPVSARFEPDENERREIDDLIKGAILNWAALKDMSPKRLRAMFLAREGMLFKRDGLWTVRPAQKPFDILADQIPWTVNVIRLPWAPDPIYSEWKTL
ncbi:hypothetical protein EPICR_140006 [Candidatus Desulfarcum epimagneticum]|uniref:Uncharacterized protein n=1 Tax=uncultured Desulfobacteraceae bacterium TaxID=218296 RepID=A0A484HDA6_9BACT|nr:hypothetical protein EPICR_140006 [uncultured Desulfobacteraceae bacterium]